MKIINKTGHRTVGALSLLASVAAFAQVAPAPTPGSTPSSSEIVTLTPFEVNTSADTGYTAANTLAGSRLNTSLKYRASMVEGGADVSWLRARIVSAGPDGEVLAASHPSGGPHSFRRSRLRQFDVRHGRRHAIGKPGRAPHS